MCQCGKSRSIPLTNISESMEKIIDSSFTDRAVAEMIKRAKARAEKAGDDANK